MICFPNAKINLGLWVIGKRDDGYHTIESVLLPVPFYDVLEFKPVKEFSLKTYGLPIGIESKENILFKTWKLLQQDYQIPPLEIILLKNVPIGSGLGGGSSNAAFLIKSINDFFELGLENEKMQQLASEIGSDCPFFIKNKTSLISGRGELINPLKLSLTGLHLVLIVPGFGISTREAYSLVAPKASGSLAEIVSKPVESWKKNLKNDFETTLFVKHPELKRLKEELYKSGAVYASMSGSGSSIFGIYENQPKLSYSLQKLVVWSGML